MIFVCSGVSRPFDRLVKEVDRIAKKEDLRFLVQLGRTYYEPKYCEYFRFKPHHEIIDLIRKSDLVITHGGFGTIYDCLALGKPVVAVPKTFELDETDNDQTEIVKFLESKGKLVGVYEIGTLENILKTTGFINSIPVKFNQNITRTIEEFIERTWARK